MGLTRRRLLAGLGIVGAGVVASRLALPHLLRVGPPRELEGEAADFVDGLFAEVDRARVWDVHAHLVGEGDGGTHCRVSEATKSHLSPIARLQYEIYMAASGVREGDDVDAAYLERLLELHRLANPRGRLVLLGLDDAVDTNGRVTRDAVPFVTPASYVLRIAAEHPDVEAGVSIHPYRRDAVGRLEKAIAAGARLVKWLPAAMGVDPSSHRCDRFYQRLATMGIPLLTHAGHEAAMEAGGNQHLGNPLRLRRPLEHGVTVIVAHCASLGEDEDIDAPEGRRARVSSFDLFLRLMGERRYERQLYGDISAITQVNRCGRPLRALLRNTDLHHRLLNGSDYPLPAIDPLVSTWELVRRGYLTSEERVLCNRVWDANPLLFDFVVKRCLRLREDGRVFRFAPTVFETGWLLG